MKRFQLACLIFLSQISPLFAQQEPKGIVIYQEPNTSYSEVIEYRSFRKENALSSSIVGTTGQLKHLKTAGVIAALEYPPYTFDEDFPDIAKSTLDKMRAIEQQSPNLRPRLQAAHGKWERALSVYQQSRKSNPIVSQENTTLPILTLKSGRYTNARLVSATYDSATIAHDAGVAKIPLTELTIPEIVNLNTTSASIQLGTISFLDEQIARNDSGSVTQKVKTIGVRVLASIASRTGLRYDAMHTWLFFIILPVLIVALIVPYIVRLFRPKVSPLRKAR